MLKEYCVEEINEEKANRTMTSIAVHYYFSQAKLKGGLDHLPLKF